MIYSAGILLWRYRSQGTKEFFVVSPGGPLWTDKYNWGPPKGQMEVNEDPWTTASREFTEETGQQLEGTQEDYLYLGPIKQRKGKTVHIFSRQYIIDIFPEDCFSNTFTWIDGKDYPEIGHYAWLTLDEINGNSPESYLNLMAGM